MASKSDVYRERAAHFENKARLTPDSSGKSFYFEVAHVYLQLAEYIERHRGIIGELSKAAFHSEKPSHDIRVMVRDDKKQIFEASNRLDWRSLD